MLRCGLDFFAAQKASKLTRQLQRGSELAIPRGKRQPEARPGRWGKAAARPQEMNVTISRETLEPWETYGADGMCVFEIYAYTYIFSKMRPLSVNFFSPAGGACMRYDGSGERYVKLHQLEGRNGEGNMTVCYGGISGGRLAQAVAGFGADSRVFQEQRSTAFLAAGFV